MPGRASNLRKCDARENVVKYVQVVPIQCRMFKLSPYNVIWAKKTDEMSYIQYDYSLWSCFSLLCINVLLFIMYKGYTKVNKIFRVRRSSVIASNLSTVTSAVEISRCKHPQLILSWHLSGLHNHFATLFCI